MSSVLIACPQCGRELKLPDRKLLGRKGKCPACAHRFVLQEPDEVPLELAEPELPVGTSAKWVPDEPVAVASAASPQKSAIASQPEPPAAGHAESLHDESPSDLFAPAIPALSEDTGGVKRLREIRRRNARRRRVGIVIGAVIALAAGGGFWYVRQMSPAVVTNEQPRPQVDAAYQAEIATLQENVDVADAASPTSGEPIQLYFVPTGARVVVNLRPSLLWSEDDRFKEFRFCLGPLGEWTAAQIKELCLYEPQEIDELLLALIYGAPGQPPSVCGVVHLAAAPKRSDLIEKFGGQPRPEFDEPVYVGRDYTYVINAQDPKTFAFAPNALNATQEMVDAAVAPSATDPGFEELLRATDRDRHLTIVFRPDDAHRHQDVLFPDNALPFANQVLDWFNPEEIETIAWAVHVGEERFHSQVLIRNKSAIPTPQLHKELDDQLDDLPQRVLAAVEMMQPKESGKRTVIGRFPAMIKALRMATLNGITDRFVQMTTVLPERAAPNLALGTLLAWDESTRTDFSKAPALDSTGEKLPATIAERLKKPIEIDFRRTPLQEAFSYIADETKVKIDIDGDALKLAGYTQNMPQTMNLGTVPATKAMHEIVKQYGEMVIVVDEAQKVATVMTKAAAAQKGVKPFPLL